MTCQPCLWHNYNSGFLLLAYYCCPLEVQLWRDNYQQILFRHCPSPESHKGVVKCEFVCFLMRTAGNEGWPLRVSERQWNTSEVALEAGVTWSGCFQAVNFLQCCAPVLMHYNQNLERGQAKMWLGKGRMVYWPCLKFRGSRELARETHAFITLAIAHKSHLLILQ